MSERLRPSGIEYLWAALAVVAITALSFVLFGRESPADVVMLYLFGSVLVSTRCGFGPSVAAALFSVIAFDLCFIPPYFSFAVTDLRHLVTFIILGLVSITINGLTTRVRSQAAAADERERRTSALYAMSRDLARAIGADEAAAVAARHVHAAFGDSVTLATDPATLADPDQRQLLEAFAAQLAVARERARSESEREAARTETMREQLKNTLLSSVSHDLRTPLTTVIGATSALLEQRELSEDARRELLEAVNEEAHRLDRLVGNLLSMTRLEAGPIAIRREVQPLEEVVGVVLNRLEPRLAGRQVTIDLPMDLPLVEVDGLLLEQLFTNLLENAVRYTPADASVAIRARSVPGFIEVQVADRGPGIPPEARAKVFEKFQRGGTDRARGTGLGLAICRAIVEAHGGHLAVGDEPGGGACFTFTLPAAVAS